MTDALLERWLEDVVSAPGMTALRSVEEARRVLLDDALRALPIVKGTEGRVVDVGSGTGSPGIPLAIELPHREFTLLEAERRKCDFLDRATGGLPHVRVVWGRAETQPAASYGVALAKALAKPPVATELVLPLIRSGGIAVLWVGPSADTARMAVVAERLGGVVETSSEGLVVIRKTGPTPPGFPRRSGLAKRRPLA